MEAMRVGKSGFEIETCGRCGGSGKYSFNLMDGDRCYGCGGSGVRRTKRGKAAYEFWQQSLRRPNTEIAVGDFILSGKGIERTRWEPVISITFREPYLSFGTESMTYGTFPNLSQESVRSMDDLAELKRAALVYQETLTKAGKPRKKAA